MVFLEPPKDFAPKFEVVSCFCVSDGKILLLKRHPSKTEGGKWGVPAGKIDVRETVFQAMERELREETGIKQKFFQGNMFLKVYVRYHLYDFEYVIFDCQADESQEIQLTSNEHTDFCWVSPEEVLTMNLVADLDVCLKMWMAKSSHILGR